MKKTYQLIKLRTGTVSELKRLMTQMAEPSLDDLINTMIRTTEEYRLVLQNKGWDVRGEVGETSDNASSSS